MHPTSAPSLQGFQALASRLLACLLLAAGPCHVAHAQGSMVRLETSLGPLDIRLYDSQTPATVANFLAYLRSGAYANSFVHRSVPGFVVQTGGYTWTEGFGPSKIPAGPPVVNEFSTSRSNLRGTVAMAKLGGNPNSATTEWFVNLANNAANLDNQNGGFTVFGKVTLPGMAIVDRMAGLTVLNIGGCFANGSALSAVPMRATPATCAGVSDQNLTMVRSARELPATATDADRVFNFIEATYPEYTQPSGFASVTEPSLGYYYRYYSGSNAYLGYKDGNLYYLVPAINNQINLLAPLADLLVQAAAAGY
jgi:cyclophilin family peptidyl-prolyl cis-trans isomerase